MKARRHFASTPAVDIVLTNGQSLSGVHDQSVDLCYSYVVLQHLPSVEIIEDYCREVFRVLAPGGLFRFQTQCVRDEGDDEIDRGGTLLGVRIFRTRLSRLLEKASLNVLEMTRNLSEEFEEVWVTARREPQPGERVPRRVLYRTPSSETANVGRD